MHFYKFHINDYAVQTRHLSNEEDLCYRRLLDFYYTEEAPIPLETDWVARRIQVDTAIVKTILNDFFQEGENGWINSRADAEIAEYHRVCEKNKSNGKRGGRPKITQTKPKGNPEGTQSKASRTLSVISNQQSGITPIVPTGDSELVLVPDEADPSDDQAYSGYPSDFETFWAAFPEKKGKGAAWRAYEKVQRDRTLPPVAELVEIIHAQQLDRNEAKKRGDFYPEWKNPSTWLNGHCWADGLKYPQKKERAAAESSTPERWRELLVDQYSENYPDGLASSNFPSAFHLLPASVQEEIRQAATLRTEIAEAIHATTQEAA